MKAKLLIGDNGQGWHVFETDKTGGHFMPAPRKAGCYSAEMAGDYKLVLRPEQVAGDGHSLPSGRAKTGFKVAVLMNRITIIPANSPAAFLRRHAWFHEPPQAASHPAHGIKRAIYDDAAKGKDILEHIRFT